MSFSNKNSVSFPLDVVLQYWKSVNATTSYVASYDNCELIILCIFSVVF